MEIHIAIAPEVLFTVGPVNVTNSMLMTFIVMGFLLIFGAALARGAKLVPRPATRVPHDRCDE